LFNCKIKIKLGGEKKKLNESLGTRKAVNKTLPFTAPSKAKSER
jgi:hypothetical protein